MSQALKSVLLDLATGLFIVLAVAAVGAVTSFQITLLAVLILFLLGGFARGRSRAGSVWIDLILLNVFFILAVIVFGLKNPSIFLFGVASLVFTYVGLSTRSRWTEWSPAGRYTTLGIILAAVVLIGIAGHSHFAAYTTDNTGSAAPQFNLQTPDGKMLLSSADAAGKIIVLDFWASWCGPCRLEFPYLQQVYDKYKDNPSIQFAAINSGSGDTIEKAKAFIERGPYSIPMTYDKGEMSDLFRIEALPTTIIIDKHGAVRLFRRGFNPSENFVDLMSAKIDTLLAEK